MILDPFRVEYIGTGVPIAVVHLEQADRPVVVIDEALIDRLGVTLESLRTGLGGLVLCSDARRAFVAGADLKAIDGLDDVALGVYLERAAGVFARLASLPYPTAAAIGGAALGGGLELAMHCDGLIGAPAPSGKPYPVGLPEAGLAICPGWGGTNLLPARIEPGEAISRTASGKPLTFSEAVERGLFDRVCESADGLIETAAAWIGEQPASPERDGMPLRWIGRVGTREAVSAALIDAGPGLPETEAAVAVARCVGAGLSDGWEAGIAAERENLIRLRHTPLARKTIDAFFARSATKQ